MSPLKASRVQTLRYLTDPALADLYWPPVIAGLAIAVLCSTLSVLVVLKRLAFVGQGISHTAFGAVGVAALLAALGAGPGEIGTRLIVLLFCVVAAIVIARLSGGQSALRTDTAIGIVLAFGMAVGFVLLQAAGKMAAESGAPPPPEVETILFGSIREIGWGDAMAAWIAAAVVLAALWLSRRPLLFWAFDEPVSEAFGVSASRMRALLMVLLALAIVFTMRLAGVVLATAMLVLPGATALAMSDRFARVLVIALIAAVVGILAGILVGFELDIQVGPAIVLTQCVLFAAVKFQRAARRA